MSFLLQSLLQPYKNKLNLESKSSNRNHHHKVNAVTWNFNASSSCFRIPSVSSLNCLAYFSCLLFLHQLKRVCRLCLRNTSNAKISLDEAACDSLWKLGPSNCMLPCTKQFRFNYAELSLDKHIAAKSFQVSVNTKHIICDVQAILPKLYCYAPALSLVI